MSVPLYDIGQRFKELELLGSSDDLPAEAIAATLEGIEAEFQDKAVAVAKFSQNLESSAEAIEAAAHAMQLRGARVRKRAESLKAYLLFWMSAVGSKRIETPDMVIARRANPPAVGIVDEALIPEKFKVQPEAPPLRIDRKAIAAALKAGEDVPGAYLEAGEKLEIRQ